MAAVAVAGPDFNALRTKLNTKKSFEEAVQECIREIQDIPEIASSDAFKQLLRRALTVMKTRFSDSDVPLWQAGLRLVRVAAATPASADPKFASELKTYEQQCLAVLGEDGERSQPPAARSHRTLFEGQLSEAQAHAHPTGAPQGAFDELAALFFGGQLGGNATENAPEENSEENRQQNGQEQQQQQQQAPTAASLTPEMAEALQRQLDAIAVEIMEETATHAVLRTLPRLKVTAEKLVELGGEDARCPVWMCLDVEDEILMLPCKHWAHPECLKPWLKGTNTCPTCRHELPTEDDAYERKKERDKVEAEERRGAENAISHKEFLYI